MRQKLQINWEIQRLPDKLKRFTRYLKDRGVRQSTLDDYLIRVGKYLQFCGHKQLL